jgi:hypothetical protein
MSKPTNKPSIASGASAAPAPTNTAEGPKGKKPHPGSKQSRVVALLSSPGGTTIPAMMKATGWQPHSVRGFLAGVVRKKLKLRLSSKKVGDQRLYRIDGGGKVETGSKRSRRRAA